MILCELRGPVSDLRGAGRARAAALRRLGIRTIADLVRCVPREWEDRTTVVPLSRAAEMTERRGGALVRVKVIDHTHIPTAPTRNAPHGTLKVIVADASGGGALVCFGRNFLARTLPVGAELLVWGQFRHAYGEIQASAFEVEAPDTPGRIVPIYSLTEGLTQGAVRGLMHAALTHAAHLQDELPATLRESEGLQDTATALRALHAPRTLDEPASARARFVFEELLVFLLRLARLAAAARVPVERPAYRVAAVTLRARVGAALPFALTADQAASVEQIEHDLWQPHQMVRLLQGDVGCGKTLVALLAACTSIERGEQVALMVPTELLAYQHANNAARLLEPHGIRVALLVGSMKPEARRHAWAAVEGGTVHLIIGTHALFSQGLRYRRLGLVIIDEQHRFGVEQRAVLAAKGRNPDILLMSATPIPRSLALTAFGDTDISTVRTMPPGRQTVETHLARMGNEEKVYRFVERELQAGRQAYFVYPRVEGGTLRDAESMTTELRRRFRTFRVETVHGRTEETQRDEVMDRFAAGRTQVLVATTVVEVGVDVANATCMVIEHAERFGLAALHQLRGRVGRGTHQSYCFLIYDVSLSEEAKQRLKVLHAHTDGFEIADHDLRMRGPGDLAGVRQSGFRRFRYADLYHDQALLERAKVHAERIMREDPGLLWDEHAGLRRALQCAEMDEQSEET